MKRLIALVAALCMAGPCFAQTPNTAKTAKVEELMSVMHLDKMMDQMMSLMKQQIMQTGESDGSMDKMNAAQKKIYTSFQANALDLVISSVSWKALEPSFVKLYADNFTDQQIDDIVAFYKTPTGQALIEKEPLLTKQAMQIAQGKVMVMIPQLKSLADQFAKDMAAAGPTKNPVPPTVKLVPPPPPPPAASSSPN